MSTVRARPAGRVPHQAVRSPSPVTAVSDLSFEVRPGRVTGFLGPNGSGKTTTLRCLLGWSPPPPGARSSTAPYAAPDPTRTSARPSRPAASIPVAPAATTCACSPPRTSVPDDAGRRRPRARRPHRRRAPTRRRVLAGDAPAPRPRRRPAARPRRPDPRRAGERARPRGHRLAARLPSRPGRGGPHRPRVQPRALRGPADGRRRGDHQPRPPRARRAARRDRRGRHAVGWSSAARRRRDSRPRSPRPTRPAAAVESADDGSLLVTGLSTAAGRADWPSPRAASSTSSPTASRRPRAGLPRAHRRCVSDRRMGSPAHVRVAQGDDHQDALGPGADRHRLQLRQHRHAHARRVRPVPGRAGERRREHAAGARLHHHAARPGRHARPPSC